MRKPYILMSLLVLSTLLSACSTALHKGKDYQGKPMFYVLFELTNTTEKHKIFS